MTVTETMTTLLDAPMGGRPETTLREALRESIREREALRKRIAVHKGA
jgi:hypothetical protein